MAARLMIARTAGHEGFFVNPLGFLSYPKLTSTAFPPQFEQRNRSAITRTFRSQPKIRASASVLISRRWPHAQHFTMT
jgi:hypothetical protein